MRSLELTLEAGMLDRVAPILSTERGIDAAERGGEKVTRRIAQITGELAEARKREVIGGPGSLLNPDHPLTKFALESAAVRARLSDARAQTAGVDPVQL